MFRRRKLRGRRSTKGHTADCFCVSASFKTVLFRAEPPEKQPGFSAAYSVADTDAKKHDSYLCTDVLTMEKHASHLYDTCIFEFTQESLRNVLNSIQKEEQGHGKAIYDYMSANSMYS